MVSTIGCSGVQRDEYCMKVTRTSRLSSCRLHSVEIRMKQLVLAFVASLLAVFQNLASAQQPQWPSKAVRLIVPGGPGGVTDIRARSLAERLTPASGHTVIVQHKPGGARDIR